MRSAYKPIRRRRTSASLQMRETKPRMTPSHAVVEIQRDRRGDAAKETDHRCTSPEIGCANDDSSPLQVNDGCRSSQFPSDQEWRRLTAYSCGGSHDLDLSACTVLPFDPRREPSPVKLEGSLLSGKALSVPSCEPPLGSASEFVGAAP